VNLIFIMRKRCYDEQIETIITKRANICITYSEKNTNQLYYTNNLKKVQLIPKIPWKSCWFVI